MTQGTNTVNPRSRIRTQRDSFATDKDQPTTGNPCTSDRRETVTDIDRLHQVRALEIALANRNRELQRVRDERDRYKAALIAIIENKRDEPFAGDFATDVLRGMTADEYAQQIRLGHAEVARKLYEGEG
jgi:hypothetical protein